jgi:uncharacterized protein (DUF1501 family)
MKRRTFLGSAAIRGGHLATLSLVGRRAWGAEDLPRRCLLVVLLRGGMDGLTAIPPLGDAALGSLRPSLVPVAPLPGNSFFGIHPSLATFAELMARGEAVAIHAAGFDYRGRSHFEGQDIMQSGVGKPFASPSGWLGRAMQTANVGTGVAISIPIPLILRGDPSAETEFPTWMSAPPQATYELVRQLWARDRELSAVGASMTGRKSAMAAASSEESNEVRRSPRGLAQQAGARMTQEDGPVVGLIDLVGFDTHASQGADEGEHASRLKMLDDIVLSFRSAMGARWKDSLVLTVTEFGRTALQNGTTGTDHGWGSCVLAAGGLVNTAGVIADWPGLDKPRLHEGRDLVATLDANAIYAQAMRSVFGLSASQIRDRVLAHKPHALAQNLFKA